MFVFPCPACFNTATVFLSPSTGDKITGLEQEFAFISFVFWVFCPGKLHADVPAPGLLWSVAAAAGCSPGLVLDTRGARGPAGRPAAAALCHASQGFPYSPAEHLHQVTETRKIQLWHYNLKFCWNSQSSVLLGDH